jgi:TolB protein
MNKTPANRQNNYNNQSGITLSPIALALIIMINVFILGFFGWQIFQTFFLQSPSTQPTSTSLGSQNQPQFSTSTETFSEQEDTNISAPISEKVIFSTSGLMIISLSEGGYFHLFAYHPENLPLTRLTFGEWDDIQPALSPDGSRVAYTSHHDGQWDIYVLNLATGETHKATDDKEYDGAPSWSGDGKRIAFEKYVDGNLDIYIIPIDGSSPPIRVTNDLAHDFSPDWNPISSKIAFTSTRGGDNDIWIIDTDHLGEADAITNFTFNTTLDQHSPSWSPQGDILAWIAPIEGYDSIYVADPISGANSANYIGSGSQATWDPSGNFILTPLQTPDQTLLASYHQETKAFNLPPFSLSHRVDGLSWGPAVLISPLPEPLRKAARMTPEAPWGLVLTLNGLAIEPFFALRDRIHSETGWDVLSDLENAFVPLSQPLSPERSNDWLYTGRAFALNSVLLDLDWMKVVREDFGPQTFWRIYLKTRYQDGSQGKPMTQFPWNFDARFSGNTSYYEDGGALEGSIPSGYWIDFTKIALEYGWERHPALSNWESYYQGSRFNVFAITSGLDWEDAMLQLWPPEIFMSPNLP